MKQLFAIALLALSSCRVVSHMRMDTIWKGEAHPGVMSTLAFDLEGAARWTFDLPSGSDVYELKYELASAAPGPMHLDFTGFTKGPFAGKTLYGIAEWNEETLRFDAKPGDPGKGGDVVRPKAFTDQARVFKRVR